MDVTGRKTKLGALGIALVGLEVFIGIGGVVSGAMLVADPRSGLGMGLGVLEGSPFKDFVIPGIILLVAVGVFPLVVAGAALARARWAMLGHVGVSAVLLGWIVVELLMLGYLGFLQPAVVAYGVVMLCLALRNLRTVTRRSAVDRPKA
jgi:hypothetical protein